MIKCPFIKRVGVTCLKSHKILRIVEFEEIFVFLVDKQRKLLYNILILIIYL